MSTNDDGELDAAREMDDILNTPGEAEAIDEGVADVRAGRVVDGPAALAKYVTKRDED